MKTPPATASAAAWPPAAAAPGRRINWFKYAPPQRFHALAGRLIPWFAVAAMLLPVAGLVLGLGVPAVAAGAGEGPLQGLRATGSSRAAAKDLQAAAATTR